MAVLGGHRDLDVHAQCKPDGLVSLTGVAISAFRMVRVPRVWENPDRRDADRTRATSSVDWRRGSRRHSMSGRRVSRHSRRDPVLATTTGSETGRALVRRSIRGR
jgi:hypothetical protein